MNKRKLESENNVGKQFFSHIAEKVLGYVEEHYVTKIANLEQDNLYLRNLIADGIRDGGVSSCNICKKIYSYDNVTECRNCYEFCCEECKSFYWCDDCGLYYCPICVSSLNSCSHMKFLPCHICLKAPVHKLHSFECTSHKRCLIITCETCGSKK